MQENKKKKIMIVAITVVALLLVVGTTFAYFVAQGGAGTSKNVTVTTDTTDSLTFTVSKALSITADQTSFAEGKGNAKDETVASAKLIAGTNRNPSYDYYMYLDIETNEFSYTTTDKTAELILTILDPEDNPITTITGLEYVTVKGVSGFDVTEKTGLIEILKHIITTNGTKVEDWDVTLTLVNLDSDQNVNAGKNFKASLIIQKEKKKGNVMLADRIKYSYGIDDALKYVETDGSYKFNETIQEGSFKHEDLVIDNNYDWKNELKDLIGTTYYCSFDDENNVNFSDCLEIEYLLSEETNELKEYNSIIEKGMKDSTSVTEEEKSKLLAFQRDKWEDEVKPEISLDSKLIRNNLIPEEYIYVNLGNWICLGSDAEKCPDENLYLIRGVFGNQVKVVKYLSIKNMAWDENGSNNWKTSTLNNYLNGEYLNSLGNLQDKIAMHDWKYGIIPNNDNIVDLESEFSEINSAKIGLMYLNEVQVIMNVDSCYWQWFQAEYVDSGFCYNIKDEWLLPASTDGQAFYSLAPGFEGNGLWSYSADISLSTEKYNVRPVFYLNSNVMVASGLGSYEHPYRIK